MWDPLRNRRAAPGEGIHSVRTQRFSLTRRPAISGQIIWGALASTQTEWRWDYYVIIKLAGLLRKIDSELHSIWHRGPRNLSSVCVVGRAFNLNTHLRIRWLVGGGGGEWLGCELTCLDDKCMCAVCSVCLRPLNAQLVGGVIALTGRNKKNIFFKM